MFKLMNLAGQLSLLDSTVQLCQNFVGFGLSGGIEMWMVAYLQGRQMWTSTICQHDRNMRQKIELEPTRSHWQVY